jgi:hypothetical protein
MAAEALAIEVMYEWAPTEEVVSVARISHFNGLWSVPRNSVIGAWKVCCWPYGYARESHPSAHAEASNTEASSVASSYRGLATTDKQTCPSV